MKGIIMCGGSGSRLGPSTVAVTKHLLPVYDKPMVYYSLSVPMLAGIHDVLVICTSRDLKAIRRLLGNGAAFGLSLSYAIQDRPGGIAEALLVGSDFLDGQPCCLILGDNLFYGDGLRPMLLDASTLTSGCLLFGHHVARAEEFGVVEFAADGVTPRRIVEKPRRPPSNTVVTGLYFYDGQASETARTLIPSPRGELEITALNNRYLETGQARLETLGRGITWLDTGTPDSLLSAGHFVQTIQERQGRSIACLEEIALDNGWIDIEAVAHTARRLNASPYGRHLHRLIESRAPCSDAIR